MKKIFLFIAVVLLFGVTFIGANNASDQFMNNVDTGIGSEIIINTNGDVCVCKDGTCKKAGILTTKKQCGKGKTDAACKLNAGKC